MFQGIGITVELYSTQFWAAQIPVERLTTPEAAVITFSGSQGFLVLIAGVLLSFAFQLLLSNFFIALGISYSDVENQSDADSDSSDLDNKITKIGTVVGLRTLGTFSITLFSGCFLAVKLSLIHDVFLGAILGLVI